MPSDSEVRERQRTRNRVTVILLIVFVAIVFTLSFSHVIKEQPPAKKLTLVEVPAVQTLAIA